MPGSCRGAAGGPSLPRRGRGGYRRRIVDDASLQGLLDDTAEAIGAVLGDLDDWGLAGTRAGQYRSDLAADAAALEVLEPGRRRRAERGVGPAPSRAPRSPW